ncbi:hypothetical protein K7X08_020359 [Anisodus acutangulus]|uniref:Uncharacterized protein n=1 Tax=Anisodus acutangulus TaxID=402998 RepID=A0A9Q1RC86_9SOLA|nr:hypothetical protein K7X08_020359 [Anisodus acutangulus]
MLLVHVTTDDILAYRTLGASSLAESINPFHRLSRLEQQQPSPHLFFLRRPSPAISEFKLEEILWLQKRTRSREIPLRNLVLKVQLLKKKLPGH